MLYCMYSKTTQNIVFRRRDLEGLGLLSGHIQLDTWDAYSPEDAGWQHPKTEGKPHQSSEGRPGCTHPSRILAHNSLT